jgi:UDP-3-O-[3-hydroxymyristoyl] glucosamine N-acyltransferase
MQVTVAELAKILNGDIVGDGTTRVSKVAKIEEGEPGALSFLSNPKYESYLYETKSSAVIVNRSFTPAREVTATLIKVDDAYASFTFLLEQFSNTMAGKSGTDKTAVVQGSAKVGSDVFIGALSFIGEKAEIGDQTKIYPQVFIGDNVKVGKNCLIYPGVRIYHDCVIGDNCIIHSGTTIGSDGFGFAPLPDRSYKKM